MSAGSCIRGSEWRQWDLHIRDIQYPNVVIGEIRLLTLSSNRPQVDAE